MKLSAIEAVVINNQVILPAGLIPIYVRQTSTGHIAYIKGSSSEAQKNIWDVYSLVAHMTIPLMIGEERHEQRWYHKFKRASRQARMLAEGEFELIETAK